MKHAPLICSALLLATLAAINATDFQVAPGGNDTTPGTQSAPFRTIQHAADLAQPGDIITVHAGVYRERINPPCGGKSDKKRIVYHQAHSTALAGLSSIKGGDHCFFNNLFVGVGGSANAQKPYGKNSDRFDGYGLWVHDTRESSLQTAGKVYYNGAQPYFKETNPLLSNGDPNVRIVQEGDSVFLRSNFGPELKQVVTKLVTSLLLGKAVVPKLAFKNPMVRP